MSGAIEQAAKLHSRRINFAHVFLRDRKLQFTIS